MTSETPAPRPRSPWAERILITVFAVLLWVPTLDTLLKIDRARPPGENRLLVTFPAVPPASFGEVQKFLGGLELYFNDHFGFRKRLIRWFQNWKLGLYHDRSVLKIILGQDHWMYWGEEQMVEHYLGTARFSEAQLQSWQKLLEKRRDWLAQRGIQYCFVIPPDKQIVYPEYLPTWLINATPTNRETKVDQLLKYMQAHSTVRMLDLRAPLMAAKKIAPVYLQNDTHWNLLGGFIGLQALGQALAEQITNLPALQLADFNWTNTAFIGGDMATILGGDAVEKNYFSFQPKPSLPQLHSQENPTYPTAKGNRRVLTVENPGSTSITAVVFTDSYGHAWEPFLGYLFKKTVLLDDNKAFNAKLITENQPGVVVNEMLERYVNTQDPEEMMRRDDLR